MRKIIKTAALMLAIAFGTTVAQAEDIKPYVGGGAGGFTFDSNILGTTNSGSAGGGFGILGADFTENIGAELRLGATGNANVWGTQYKLGYFFSYLAKFQFPASEELNIYGLVGGTTANLKTALGANVTKTGLSFGGGIDFKINDQISLGAEYVRYWNSVTVSTGVDVTVDGVSGALRFHF